jgi:hypothetical protein
MRRQSSISKRQPLRVRKIFPCHSRGDLSSLFRGSELARLREEGIWGASQERFERQVTDGELLEELTAAFRAAEGTVPLHHRSVGRDRLSAQIRYPFYYIPCLTNKIKKTSFGERLP